MRGSGDAARAGRYAADKLVSAKFAELLGLCRGIIADRRVVDHEVVALGRWLGAARDRLPEWPTRLLLERLLTILADGHVDDEERVDLLAFLDEFVAGGPGLASTTLPFDHPEPFVEYAGNRFALTGTFVFGTRRQVATQIEEEGGEVTERVAAAHFLVVGAMITPAWKYGTHGLKIESAVAARASRGVPKIVSEEHWVTSLV